MNLIDQLPTISNEEASRLLSAGLASDLGKQIMATAAHGPQHAGGFGARSRRRLLPIPILATVAAAAVAAATIGLSGGTPEQPAASSHANVEALVFMRHGGYIDVIIRNPYADPRKYAAEFRAHGLDISLQLQPVSPSLVGEVVDGMTAGPAITLITTRRDCWERFGSCPVGVRVPLDYRGGASIIFGRAARPGEHYDHVNSVTAPGELMHGMRIQGATVATLKAELKGQHLSVQWTYTPNWLIKRLADGPFNGRTVRIIAASKVPGNWHVYWASPLMPGFVTIDVGQSRVPPALSRPAAPRRLG